MLISLLYYIIELLLQEASLQYDAASFDLAVNLFRVLCKTDASNLCSALDNH